MNKYEALYVIDAAMEDQARADLIALFQKLATDNGAEIEKVDEWGKRRLAYPINDEEEGVYTVINFTSEPSFPAELDRVYKITEGFMRSLIVAHEE